MSLISQKTFDEEWVKYTARRIDRIRSVSKMKGELEAMHPTRARAVCAFALTESKFQYTWSWLQEEFAEREDK